MENRLAIYNLPENLRKTGRYPQPDGLVEIMHVGTEGNAEDGLDTYAVVVNQLTGELFRCDPVYLTLVQKAKASRNLTGTVRYHKQLGKCYIMQMRDATTQMVAADGQAYEIGAGETFATEEELKQYLEDQGEDTNV